MEGIYIKPRRRDSLTVCNTGVEVLFTENKFVSHCSEGFAAFIYFFLLLLLMQNNYFHLFQEQATVGALLLLFSLGFLLVMTGL